MVFSSQPILSAQPVVQSSLSPIGSPGEQILDLDAALGRVDGDRELLVEMADLFLDEYPRLLTTLRDAVAHGNAQTAAYAAHTLKGSVANFAAMPSFTAAQKLERIARQGDLTQAHAAFADLEAQLTRLKPVLANLKIGITA
jgi:HPt (histidine-containing phosphotransfer) domain-containing protein